MTNSYRIIRFIRCCSGIFINICFLCIWRITDRYLTNTGSFCVITDRQTGLCISVSMITLCNTGFTCCNCIITDSHSTGVCICRSFSTNSKCTIRSMCQCASTDCCCIVWSGLCSVTHRNRTHSTYVCFSTKCQWIICACRCIDIVTKCISTCACNGVCITDSYRLFTGNGCFSTVYLWTSSTCNRNTLPAFGIVVIWNYRTLFTTCFTKSTNSSRFFICGFCGHTDCDGVMTIFHSSTITHCNRR